MSQMGRLATIKQINERYNESQRDIMGKSPDKQPKAVHIQNSSTMNNFSKFESSLAAESGLLKSPSGIFST